MSKQQRYCLAVLATAIALTATRPASALPAPKGADVLEKESDFVGKVRVLTVVCTGEVEVGKPGKDKFKVLAYQGLLQVVEVKKGTVKVNEALLVRWQELPKGLVGGWRVAYYPGEEAATHLKWNTEHKAYDTTWWNAKGKPTKEADVKTLPEKIGAFSVAKP